jgi:pilus assembly protein CpaB
MNSRFGGHYPVPRDQARRQMLVYIAAVGFFLAMLLVFLMVSRVGTTPPVVSPALAKEVKTPVSLQTVTLYTPASFINEGSKLSDFKFKEIYWPRNSVPDQAVHDLTEIKNMYAAASISRGTPILRTQLRKDRGSPTLPVAKGMRAVAIGVDATSGVEGWAFAGTRVDVSLTYKREGKYRSKIIISNARVLSKNGVADTVQSERRGTRTNSSRTVTLEVTPKGVLILQTAKQLGKLDLVMRNPIDPKAPKSEEVTQAEIYGEDSGPARRRSCDQGSIRIEGRSYISCDGKLHPVTEGYEP